MFMARSDATKARASEHLSAATAHLRGNRPLEAFESADRALAIDAESSLGWLLLGTALEALGERANAVMALERSVALDPRQPAVLARLGRLHDAMDRPLLAERCWLDALAFDPDDAASHLELSALYGRAAQFELGREHALRALALNPNLLGAHQNLAGIHAKLGNADEAKRHRDLAYRDHNLISVTTSRPLRRVLILASAEWGNTPDRYLLPLDRYDRHIWFVEYATREQVPPWHDVVFNAIGDPDATGPTAAHVELFVGACERPVLNPPARIARTARDLASSLFAGIDHLVMPKTIRIGEDVEAKALAGPLLLRPIGSHGGEGLKLLADVSAVGAAVGAAFILGREHYVTEFRDFRSHDGHYRKYRMFFVDREPYPYHLAIGDDWLVHYDKSGTANHTARLDEERRYLENPEAVLGAAAMGALRAMGRRLDLDFCGVDFSLLPDGRVLLFEANATMLVHPEAPEGPLAHKNVHVERILKAFWALLECGHAAKSRGVAVFR